MKRELNTPRWIDALIDNLAPHHLAEEIHGDLYEMFLHNVAQNGVSFARRRYILDGLGFLAKQFFWNNTKSNSTSTSMIRNYFKMASRSLLAHKGTTVINILGLVIGMASAFVILTVIRFETSFDTFHSNTDNIYRLVRVSGKDMSEFRTGISYPVPSAMKAEIPNLSAITSMEYFGGANIDVVDASGSTVAMFREEAGCVLVDAKFFKIFDFNDADFTWLAGNPQKALIEPMSVVLTKTMARKYFGDRNPVGETLRFQKKFDCKVTGVTEDFPPNTDFPFQIMISYSSLEKVAGKERLNDWFSVNDTHHTYLILPDGVSKGELENLVAKVHAAHTPKDLHENRHYLLESFSDLHYDARFGNFSGRTISRATIAALGIIAGFLLLTASINYINLYTAQSTLRAKEIGLRKVMGSNRGDLTAQFLLETFIVVLLAGVIALGLSEFILMNIQSILELKVDQHHLADPVVWLSLLATVVVVTLFSGLYPAIRISGFNPSTALKNKFSTETLSGLSLRKVLVVTQFTITQMLVVGTFIVLSQMRYFQNVDMGFTQDAIITARVPDTNVEKIQLLDQLLREQSFVSDVSFSFTLPSGITRNRSYTDIGKSDASEMDDFTVHEYGSIDSHYLELYEIKLLAGRNLTPQDSVGNILINKTLVKNLALGNPADVIGKQLKRGDGKLVTVVGVIEDYFSNSLKEGVDNILIEVNTRNFSTLSIRFNNLGTGEAMAEKIKAIEKIWTATFPDFIFNYQFFDENVQAFYQQEQKYATLFQMFSAIFLFIGCLGLYGLITFVINRKGKEVAIRRVLGAKLSNILVLFSREYIQLIVLSFVLATPVTYYVVRSWLSNFANQIELKWWLFVTPGFLVLIIALLVVGIKSLKAANANPVDRLKYE